MKTMIAILTLLTSFAAHAESTSEVPCQREIIAAALAERASSSTLEFLMSADYYVESFHKRSEGKGYYVGIETKHRTEGFTVTIGYDVTVKNSKTCEVTAQMLAD